MSITDSPELVYYPEGKPPEKKRLEIKWVNIVLLIITILIGFFIIFREGWIPGREDSGSVKGVLVDSVGEPVSNAWVYIVDIQASAISEDDGTFTIEKSPVGEQYLVIEVTPSTPVFYPLTVARGGVVTDVGQIQVSP